MNRRRAVIRAALVLACGASAIASRHVPGALVNVRGTVVDDRGVVRGAVVRVVTSTNSTVTDRRGRFVLDAGPVPEGRLALAAWAPDHFCGGAKLSVASSAATATIRLRRIPLADHTAYEWLPGTSARVTAGGQGCAGCHSVPGDAGSQYPVEQWLRDAHSRSATNPIFLTMYQGTDVEGHQGPVTRWGSSRDYGRYPLSPDPTRPYFGPGYRLDFPATAGNCAACHVPAAAASNAYGVDPTTVSGVALEGVTCDFCHKVLDVRLNPATALPYPGRPGVLSFEFRRPRPGHQFFSGPFDDVTAGDDTFAPVMRKSAFCAPCHFGVFWGTVVYNSYGEWLASPYADPKSAHAKSCQDCHMPKGDAEYFALPDKGGLLRQRGTLSTHLMTGVTDEQFMRGAASMTVTAQRQHDGVHVTVSVTNDRTGHHLPTDSPLRHVILMVEAHSSTGGSVACLEGPKLPDWTGKFGGRPGRVFAKILADEWRRTAPAASYWAPCRIISDTRIPAFSTDRSEYVFGADTAVVEARLTFRRAYEELASIKKWPIRDVPMAEVVYRLPGLRAPLVQQ